MNRYAAVIVALLASAPLHPLAQPSDADALGGLQSVKVVYDVSSSEKRQLLLYLTVIRDAVVSARQQGVRSEVVVAFRGPAVTLISPAPAGAAPDQAQLSRDVHSAVSALQAEGVRFEACSYALNLLKVEAAGVFPEVKRVGNTFNSLAGYQSKGYSLVPVH